MINAPETFDCPPLPPMTRGEFWWEGTDTLTGWGDLQVQRHGYNLEPWPLGRVKVRAVTEDPYRAPRPPFTFATPFPQQARAYQFLRENSSALFGQILEAVFQYYPEIRIDYEDVPDVRSTAELKKFIGIYEVTLSQMCKGDSAYIGFEFACTWDSEHGLGVMTHGTRVLGVGQSVVADDLPPPDDGGVFAPNSQS